MSYKDNTKHLYTTELSTDGSEQIQPAMRDLPSIGNRMNGGDGQNVEGDADATGTTILTFNISIGKKFALTHIMGHCNVDAVFELITGTLAAATPYYSFRIKAGENKEVNKDNVPILIIDNSAGVAVLPCLLILPQVVDGFTDNNAVNHYASGSVWGVEF